MSFTVVSLEAAGTPGEAPPIDPNSIRIKPENGVIVGEGAKLDAKQITAKVGATASVDGDAVKITLPNTPAYNKGDQIVTIKPPQGRLDFRDALKMRVKVKNTGKIAISPKAMVGSNGGPTEWVTAENLAPGAEAEIVIPFFAKSIYNGEKDSGNRVTNNTISEVAVAVPAASAERSLLITSVKGNLPPAPPLPEWLGKKPPVDGDWTQTFTEEFDGPQLDDKKWNDVGENYYDKITHWSKDELSFDNGVLNLRYEKKTGHQNDDPAGKETPYAAGFIDTFGKWAQRYGYFECRMKLPTAPGLWPGFWMMPDRGAAFNKSKGARSATANHGMEFDIVEFLSGWGAHRYNIAMHYDGYGKDHKALGSEKNHVWPDKDGYITAGLLWTPRSLEYYGNGIKILEWKNERVSDVPAYFLFTYPAGGWDNLPIDDAQLPADWKIDYVRCWQRKDLASDKDGMRNEPKDQP